MRAALRSGEHERSGWIVVGATFVTLGMVYGVWYSYSVFFVAFLREFQWSRSIIAGGYSAFVLIHGTFSPISGWLAGRVGPWRVGPSVRGSRVKFLIEPAPTQGRSGWPWGVPYWRPS